MRFRVQGDLQAEGVRFADWAPREAAHQYRCQLRRVVHLLYGLWLQGYPAHKTTPLPLGAP